ncbi:hypothetical protein LCGC14_1319990 [marine sediment metagenome]|uniref:Uncharacterized protein n=1 Tax=marine sediment metagenome TaxID=412755 RepID=A0A0F9N0K0_9ZZZZ|nr:hypothetical protein [Candidatus Aminicenantes bacterium]
MYRDAVKEHEEKKLRERHDLADPMQYLIKHTVWCSHCRKDFDIGLSPDYLKERMKMLKRRKK